MAAEAAAAAAAPAVATLERALTQQQGFVFGYATFSEFPRSWEGLRRGEAKRPCHTDSGLERWKLCAGRAQMPHCLRGGVCVISPTIEDTARTDGGTTLGGATLARRGPRPMKWKGIT